jgi:hypothetical protein
MGNVPATFNLSILVLRSVILTLSAPKLQKHWTSYLGRFG